jgi:hypothetical protein
VTRQPVWLHSRLSSGNGQIAIFFEIPSVAEGTLSSETPAAQEISQRWFLNGDRDPSLGLGISEKATVGISEKSLQKKALLS